MLLSCSDNRSGTPDSGELEGIIDYPDAEISDVPIIDTQEPDSGIDDNLPSVEYRLRCWQRQYFFCTPDGGILPDAGDESLYRQEMTIDICDENGDPCTPEGPNDPNCQWTIIWQGICEDWLECNPEEHLVHEDVLCQIIDEITEETTNGLQDWYCEKGQLKPGPCVPCDPEICDSIDNDCNGIVDDLPVRDCENDCGPGDLICVEGVDMCFGPEPQEEICDYIDNDCDGDVDEGQLNACNTCGPVPEDICDGIDNDCDGTIDLTALGEPLVDVCETACGFGQDVCIEGIWSCNAPQPEIEICDNIDNDCNGLIDDGIDCQCPPELIGALLPCMGEPLVCGQGFQTCECVDPLCAQTQYTPCVALCVYFPTPGVECDPTGGQILPEVCNNWDDDCNTLIDDEIPPQGCYTGPPGTMGVGICVPGEQTCILGEWGSVSEDGTFFANICAGEQVPLEEELCNNQDDDCDGLEPEELEPTDVLFIIDTSGSMDMEINAVFSALNQFAAFYSDAEVIQWGLIIGPTGNSFGTERLELKHQLSSFQNFIANPFVMNPHDYSTSSEMLLDALYLSLSNLVPQGVPLEQLVWEGGVSSTPSLENFQINWREDTNKVIIMFSDEEAQSFADPEITANHINLLTNEIDDLFIYTFSPDQANVKDTWTPLIVGGAWHELTTLPIVMFEKLMEIIEESACGGL
ncbi:MAG: hypothetical protein CMQ41_07895 [Gammaproteobacteria bacterium]|nr:hypothetical protein [Gammaproteobacteria bacterium]